MSDFPDHNIPQTVLAHVGVLTYSVKCPAQPSTAATVPESEPSIRGAAGELPPTCVRGLCLRELPLGTWQMVPWVPSQPACST